MNITLSEAKTICDKALEQGKALGLAPLTVAVLDAGGTLVCLQRDDNSSLLRPEIAIGKAWGTLGMGFGGREIFRRATAQPDFFTTLSLASGGRLIPVPGGVLVRRADGKIAGAVGVTGDTSINDEICAVHGIESAGLNADNGGEDPK